MQSGSILIKLFSDFAQLSPVTDKPLYHSIPSGNTALMGYSVYRSLTTVVKLAENEGVYSEVG